LSEKTEALEAILSLDIFEGHKGESMKILLAIDSSAPSEHALAEVAARPWLKSTTVCVLNVIEPGLLGEELQLMKWASASVMEMATEGARTMVDRAAEALRKHHLEAATAVVKGDPRIEIADYAKKWDADMIVVGSHGRSGVKRLLMGSVARTVLRHAHCSVEVVRPRRNDFGAMSILLATDGSPCSIAAAKSIAERPWPEESEVRIVSVVEISMPVTDPMYIDPDLAQSLADERTKQAREAVQEAERIIARGHLKMSSIQPVGIPASIILQQVDNWRADLVVMGSHGRHGLERLLIGSVSESVAIHAPCSVEVIRRKAPGV
jgi:nucleotide-binding universal stress UspA family protein